MTPLQITMLFHFDHIAEPWPRSAPACDAVVSEFLGEGLIRTSQTSGSGFETTERGKALVEHLCQVEYPVAVWVQPRREPI